MTSYYTEDELYSLGFKSLGSNCNISRKASFYSPKTISLGDNVRIDDFCILSGNISIGSHVHISAYVALYGSNGIILEDFTGISPHSTIYSAMDDFSGEYLIGPIHPKWMTNVTGGAVLVKRFSQIGANSVVFPNVTIGEGVVVGACTMVRASLEEWNIYIGFPAKLLKPRSKGLLKYITSPICSIIVLTYNHAPFIRNCLDSLLMQKTDFSFEIIIHDDASQDGTTDIIKDYESAHPNLIRPIYETENQFSKTRRFAFDKMAKIAKGKYIAFCEGDDFWTDSNKLQRQVNFLNQHEDYVAYAENAIVNLTDENTSHPFSNENERDVTVKELILERRFPTAGVICRKQIWEQLFSLTEDWHDTMTWAFLCSKGKFHYSPIISSCYNRGTHGMVMGTPRIKWAKTQEYWTNELKKLFCPTFISNGELNTILLSIYYPSKYYDTKTNWYFLFKTIRYRGVTSAFLHDFARFTRPFSHIVRLCKRIASQR